MYRAQLVGATGYGGLGILELLLGHPDFEVSSLVARDDAGKRIDDVYPHLTSRCELVVEAPDTADIGGNADIVIFATPDRVSMGYAAGLADRGVRFIDYSGDFRFATTQHYAEYAAAHPGISDPTHPVEALLGRAAYGIPELFQSKVADAAIVGNPGCFAAGMIIGLAPMFADKLVEDGRVTVDAITGSSGAGKKPAPIQHFPHLNDNVIPYRVFNHQHVTETEQTLGALQGSKATVDFVPQVIGATRGILCSMHVALTRPITREQILDRYREFYEGQPFVRILNTPPTLKSTAGSNYIDISAVVSPDGKRAVIISSIDNLLKGQSGTAMQNINIMFGLDPKAGLDRGPVYP
ncbi:MAG: N-acetyl-gamma-glutamyl-phosphate reductase [Chloroflexi bacterium]|nr:MAG: N-acetyl-gamma-glutamyl-phosphate reductase [Chloroflexota bacterium]